MSEDMSFQSEMSDVEKRSSCGFVISDTDDEMYENSVDANQGIIVASSSDSEISGNSEHLVKSVRRSKSREKSVGNTDSELNVSNFQPKLVRKAKFRIASSEDESEVKDIDISGVKKKTANFKIQSELLYNNSDSESDQETSYMFNQRKNKLSQSYDKHFSKVQDHSHDPTISEDMDVSDIKSPKSINIHKLYADVELSSDDEIFPEYPKINVNTVVSTPKNMSSRKNFQISVKNQRNRLSENFMNVSEIKSGFKSPEESDSQDNVQNVEDCVSMMDISDRKSFFKDVMNDSKEKIISNNSNDSIEKSFKSYRISNHHSSSSSNSESSKYNSNIIKGRKQNPVNLISIVSSSEDEKAEYNDSSSNESAAISFTQQETGFEHVAINLKAQQEALLRCKLDYLHNQLAKSEQLTSTVNVQVLPDKGMSLIQNMEGYKREIREIKYELRKLESPNIDSIMNHEELPKNSFVVDEELNTDRLYLPPSLPTTGKELGKKALENRENEIALTVDRLKDLHGSLIQMPSEDDKAKDPKGLKVKLMPHQQHALAWLLWREKQKPAGGILADDMGLGKTLTMIALVMTTEGIENHGYISDDEENSWIARGERTYCKGGTLVICPTSLLSQWENEVKTRCNRGFISAQIYHGNKRENKPKRLATIPIVITTYNIVAREHKTRSTLFQIDWKRIILDEAHVIRNHKSQASEGVCALRGSKRWALTGTPVHNKEQDLYAIFKFLKCSPFDDLRVWKRWINEKSKSGLQRLAMLMKSLMLRRTKQELQAKGTLECLPEKFFELIEVTLDSQEKVVYEKVLIYSRSLFAEFLAKRAEKQHFLDLGHGKYNKPSFSASNYKDTQFTKAQTQLLKSHADVKAHEILVLLLRLRQICCHPALIHAMLDQEDMQGTGFVQNENLDPTLMKKLSNISIVDDIDNAKTDSDEEDIGVDIRVKEKILTSENPVFRNDRISSKMKIILKTVKKISQTGDKLIIVSQWTSLLGIIAQFLPSITNAKFTEFSGKTAIKDRQGIMDEFNDKNSKLKILLLTLTTGGVGLNLVGGNHLLLVDNHWNPQLESQAQDRIYRFGQTKNVYIYKFICKDTVEERIHKLQEFKIQLANNLLGSETKTGVTKLSMDDLKSLFGF